MKTLLFPRWCRFVGFILLPLALALFNAAENYNFTFSFLATKEMESGSFITGNSNLTDEVSYAGIIISLFMIGFSKLKTEDEYIMHMRLRSLNLAVYLNYLLILGVVFSAYGFGFLILLVVDIIVIPTLYIIIFNYNLYIRPRLFKRASL